MAADWQRKLVDLTEYRLPDMDPNGVDMQATGAFQGTMIPTTPAGSAQVLNHCPGATLG